MSKVILIVCHTKEMFSILLQLAQLIYLICTAQQLGHFHMIELTIFNKGKGEILTYLAIEEVGKTLNEFVHV